MSGRVMGALESVVDLVDRARSLNFVVIADVAGPLELGALRAALDDAQRLHPLLAVSIERRGATAVFRGDGVGPVPLRVIDGDADTVAYATEEMNQPLARDTGPLLRSTWIRRAPDRSTLLLTFNHTVGDGTSGALLLRDVLALAGGRAPRAPLLTPPTIEERTPAAARGLFGLARFFTFVARELWSYARRGGLPRRLRWDVDAPVEAVEARMLQRVIDGALLERLITRARAERTTVHGALEAALMLAWVACEERGRTSVLGLGSPVNLRHRLEPPVGDDVGLFVALAQTTHRVRADAPFWPLAREARAALAKSVERGDPFSFAPVVGWLVPKLSGLFTGPDGPKRVAALVHRMITATTGITNLGVLAIERTHGPLSIERIELTVSPSAMADLVTTAATFDGRLAWNFVYNTPRVAKARVEALADAALEALRRATA